MEAIGGLAQREASVAANPAQEFPLEIVDVSADGRARRRLTDIRVTVRDPRSEGPHFLERLSKTRYTLTTRSDAWSFMDPVTIDKGRKRVVLKR
jgi:hypothetical protein